MTGKTTLPPIQGEIWQSLGDCRYRLWTIDHATFDQFPPYDDGGPATVPLGAWGISCSSLSKFFSSQSVIDEDDGLITLNVSRNVAEDGVYGVRRERHSLDGTKYANRHDAIRAAYEAGLEAFMVYLKDEGRYGVGEGDN